MPTSSDSNDQWVCACGVCQTLRALEGHQWDHDNKWSVTRDDMLGAVRRLHGLRSKLADEKQRSAALQTEVDALRSDIEDMNNKLQYKTGMIKTNEVQRRTQARKIGARTEIIAKQAREILAKAALIRMSGKALRRRNAIIEAQARDIQAKDDMIADQAQRLETRNLRVLDQEQQMTAAGNEILRQRYRIAELEAEVSNVRAAADETRRQRNRIAELEAVLGNVRSAIS
jgi:chromosome segregation ATPase